MHPAWVDVGNELDEIAREVARLSLRLERVGTERPATGSQEEWEATLVCASAAEKIYTGCEWVMARLASEVDGVPVTHSEGWHGALLRRMSCPFPQVRGPIISGKCHAVLDRLRAFRHRERNTYGVNLDFGTVVERAHEAVAGFEIFRREVRTFAEETCASDGGQ